MQEHIAGPSFFKGVTINAKMRLDHELLSSPEPHILKWLGYISKTKKIPYQDWNTILMPENRVLNAFGKRKKHEIKGLAIIHELTHVYAVSAFRKKKINGYENRFLMMD
ncbi:hypothetical protein CJF42_20450 [Pseudoalteromonas sp. NBT06-2]|nr:hypothetical protein CJF42_20450 [Pseudoalteromonas sp. NBT06-2]